MIKYISFVIALLLSLAIDVNAQHNIDANAIRWNDTRISGWATTCTVERGWKDIADKSQGLVTAGTEQNAIGPIGMNSSVIVSLGDSGVAVLTFDAPIKNVEGPDFAVFENGFLDPLDTTNAFLEVAFVEVSSDGVRFVRFPAVYNGQDTSQVDNFTYSKGYDYVNLAGRYVNGYGTPFDLEELKDSVGLDVNNITHIRLVDVIGSIDSTIGSKDHNGKMINDPYTTAFASGGFDLSGIAVLNQASNAIFDRKKEQFVYALPNPASHEVRFFVEKNTKFHYQIVNVLGQIVKQGWAESGAVIAISDLTAGSYFANIKYDKKKSTIKFIKQ